MSDEAKKGSAVKKIIIGVVILVVVGAAAYGGMYFAGKKNTTQKPVEIVEATYSLDEFLVNLTDEDGRRYLKTKVVMGYAENTKLDAELEIKKPIIRDAVIATLRSKSTADFTATGVDALKKELIGRINPILTKGKIIHIYFNDILVQ